MAHLHVQGTAKTVSAQLLTRLDALKQEDWAALDFAAICRRTGPTVLDIYVDPAPMSPQGMY